MRLRVAGDSAAEIVITVAAHGGIRARCSACRQPSPGYDRLCERRWEFPPLWGIPASFLYAPRRVQCAEHGVIVEHIPVLAAEAGQALHVLDRFHIAKHMNQAVDEVRRAESTRLRASSKEDAKQLKSMRWPLLRKGSRVRGRARKKLNALLESKLDTARAWELKEVFHHFWTYKSILHAGGFLDAWCERALRSRLEPMKKVARMLQAHEELLLNWFRAKGELSSAAVEGQNNKIRVVTRRSYGFRTYKAMEMALYHALGRLPEPESTHRFC